MTISCWNIFFFCSLVVCLVNYCSKKRWTIITFARSSKRVQRRSCVIEFSVGLKDGRCEKNKETNRHTKGERMRDVRHAFQKPMGNEKPSFVCTRLPSFALVVPFLPTRLRGSPFGFGNIDPARHARTDPRSMRYYTSAADITQQLLYTILSWKKKK